MKRIKSLSVNNKPLKLCKLGGVVMFEATMGQYEELTYIESSETGATGQAIDTGIAANSVDGFETCIEVLDGCVRYGTFMTTYCEDAVINYDYHSSADHPEIRIVVKGKSIGYYPADNPVNIKYHPGMLVVDDTQIEVENLDCLNTIFNVGIFGNMWGARYGLGRMYYFRLYSGESLVADFHPCRRVEDNVIGMYNTIDGLFYENSGSGVFAGGEPTGRYF